MTHPSADRHLGSRQSIQGDSRTTSRHDLRSTMYAGMAVLLTVAIIVAAILMMIAPVRVVGPLAVLLVVYLVGAKLLAAEARTPSALPVDDKLDDRFLDAPSLQPTTLAETPESGRERIESPWELVRGDWGKHISARA